MTVCIHVCMYGYESMYAWCVHGYVQESAHLWIRAHFIIEGLEQMFKCAGVINKNDLTRKRKCSVAVTNIAVNTRNTSSSTEAGDRSNTLKTVRNRVERASL